MDIKLEMTKEEFKEFLDIIEDYVHNSGQDLPVLENILGQLLEIDSKQQEQQKCDHLFVETIEGKLLCFNCSLVTHK